MDMRKVMSSNIEEVGYSAQHKILVIRFGPTSVYKYEVVEQHVYDGFWAEGVSVGSYFHTIIKNTYQGTKVDNPELFIDSLTDLDASPAEDPAQYDQLEENFNAGAKPPTLHSDKLNDLEQSVARLEGESVGMGQVVNMGEEVESFAPVQFNDLEAIKEDIVYVIDLSWLHSRSKFAFQQLSHTVDGVSYNTGVLYGVHDVIIGILARHGSDVEIILAMDGSNYLKHEISSGGGYKSGRDTVSTISENVTITRWDTAKAFTVLPQVSIQYHDKMEADEVMGHLALTKRPEQKMVIISGDGDMRQCINSANNVFCAQDFKNGFVLEDEEHLFKHGIKGLEGLTPDSVALYLSIVGDDSDFINGIPRFLKAVAKWIANQCKDLETLKRLLEDTSAIDDKKTLKGLEQIKAHMSDVEKNWTMVNIDPWFLPETLYADTPALEDGLGYFMRMGCNKVHGELSIYVNKDK